MDAASLNNMADALMGVNGAVGLGLGGSRGLGIADVNSDYDFVLIRSGGEQIKAADIGKALEPIVHKITYPKKGEFVQAEISGVKIEVFQTDLVAMVREIEMALQGKFRWSNRPLFPHGDLSTRSISHLVYLDLLRECDDQVSLARKKALPFPISLKKSLIQFFLQQAAFAKTHAAKVRSQKDLHYLLALVSGFVYFLDIVLFALNDCYPVLEKGGGRLLEKFKLLPSAYGTTIRLLFELALSSDSPALIRQMDILLEDFERKAKLSLASQDITSTFPE